MKVPAILSADVGEFPVLIRKALFAGMSLDVSNCGAQLLDIVDKNLPAAFAPRGRETTAFAGETIEWVNP